MKNYILVTIISIFFLSCDPGYYGDILINNQTNESFQLHYESRYKDTVIQIPNQTVMEVMHFGGLGDGSAYVNGLNEFVEISLLPIDTTIQLTKEITNPDHWDINNANKHRMNNKKIICTFTISPEDIQ